jgi:hypothetical protein
MRFRVDCCPAGCTVSSLYPQAAEQRHAGPHPIASNKPPPDPLPPKSTTDAHSITQLALIRCSRRPDLDPASQVPFRNGKLDTTGHNLAKCVSSSATNPGRLAHPTGVRTMTGRSGSTDLLVVIAICPVAATRLPGGGQDECPLMASSRRSVWLVGGEWKVRGTREEVVLGAPTACRGETVAVMALNSPVGWRL